MTTLRDLPLEILNLIAGHIPQDVYSILATCTPPAPRTVDEEPIPEAAETIGCFSDVELANAAAEAFLIHKLLKMIYTEELALQSSDDPDMNDYAPVSVQDAYALALLTRRDGTNYWSIKAKSSEYNYTVVVVKQTVRTKLWSREELPMPVNYDFDHDEDCLCCNDTRVFCSSFGMNRDFFTKNKHHVNMSEEHDGQNAVQKNCQENGPENGPENGIGEQNLANQG